MQRVEIIVEISRPKIRLEDFLFEQFPGLSRMYLRRVVKEEKCEVNGRLENIGYRLRGGDFLEVEVDLTMQNSMRPENVPLDIVFEDQHLIVVNKPAGMLVHPTNRDKNGTLLNALVFHLNSSISDLGFRISDFEQPSTETKPDAWVRVEAKSETPNPNSQIIRPGLVHRLDKQTSGLIVIAKSLRAHRSLAKQFQKKYVEKKYLALVDGLVEKDEGTINAAIGRFADQKMWDVKDGGKHAETRYRVLERNGHTTLVELEPVTGRTNQLRIHCASMGHPIVGDIARGGSEFERLCLHAWRMVFRHPVTREDLTFEVPLVFGRS